MTLQYQPEPWQFTRIDGASFRYHVEASSGRAIAMIWHHPGQRPKAAALEQEEADARLIAAAPDLLAALECLLPILDNDSAIGKRALAAIAKATGKEERT